MRKSLFLLILACTIPFFVQAQDLSVGKCTDKQMKEMKANTVVLSDEALPAPADGKYPETPKVKLPLLSKGNTAYAIKAYVSPYNYVSFDVESPTNQTALTNGNSGIVGGDAIDGVLYAYNTSGHFLKINSTTGVITQTITGVWNQFMSDMAYNYSNFTMYSIRGMQLYTVNLTTGMPTPIATLTGMHTGASFCLAFAIDFNGNAYAIPADYIESGLYSVNLSTGVCTLIGNTGTRVNNAQSMGFDHNTGVLYWAQCGGASGNNFMILNTSTGAATLIESMGGEALTSFHVPFALNHNVAKAPTNLEANTVGTTLSANISWTNPSTTISGAALTSITKMVVERNGTIINEITSGVTVGGNMNFTDDDIPSSGHYTYSVYAVTSEGNGFTAFAEPAKVGDWCNVRIEMQDNYNDGWDLAGVNIRFGNSLVGRATIKSGSSGTANISCPASEITFDWGAGAYDSECAFQIYDADDNLIYSSSGTPTAGVFLTRQHVCQICEPATNLTATYTADCNAQLTWNATGTAFNVYRDGLKIASSITEKSYTDTDFNTFASHTWGVTVVCTSNESAQIEKTLAACETPHCNPVTDATAVITNCEKVTITWSAVAGATGYEINGELVTNTEYVKYSDFEHDITYSWEIYTVCGTEKSESVTIRETANCTTSINEFANSISIYPNPANNNVNIEGENIAGVAVYNSIGQHIAQYGNVNTIDISSYNAGIYFFNILTTEGRVERTKVVVAR